MNIVLEIYFIGYLQVWIKLGNKLKTFIRVKFYYFYVYLYEIVHDHNCEIECLVVKADDFDKKFETFLGIG